MKSSDQRFAGIEGTPKKPGGAPGAWVGNFAASQ
jgi:hypothetical protein